MIHITVGTEVALYAFKILSYIYNMYRSNINILLMRTTISNSLSTIYSLYYIFMSTFCTFTYETIENHDLI